VPHVRIWPGGDGQPSSLPGPIGSQRLLFILISKGREADASDLIGPEPSEHLPDQKQGACLAEKPKRRIPVGLRALMIFSAIVGAAARLSIKRMG
jgi:hypothetical protein